jgi:hypothetical protein
VKKILSATWIFCVLVMPGFAGAQDTPRGDQQLSVPQQLILIQDTLSNIESVVDHLSPLVPQPTVTLATDVLYLLLPHDPREPATETRGNARCDVTNVSDAPLDVVIRMFSELGFEITASLVTLPPKTSNGIARTRRSGYWCEFSVSGPASAVRANLTIYDSISVEEGGGGGTKPLATTHAR